jgi:hypothetical protein
VAVSDLFEDLKFIGGVRFGTTLSDKDILLSVQKYRKMIDYGFTYYRSNVSNYFGFFGFNTNQFNYDNEVITNLYQVNLAFPLNEINSFRFTTGIRLDKGIVKPVNYTGYPDSAGLTFKDSTSAAWLSRIEFVHDNTLNPTQNIWYGTRWKIYFDYNLPVSKGSSLKGRNTFNLGFDARHYHRIYRNFIWATRVAGDYSFGDAKLIYYLGGVDGWAFSPKFNFSNQPDPSQTYAYQSLTVNMRGYIQNVANGSSAVVINSEYRLPVFTTFMSKPINNAFVRNFQLVQFIDLGTAWNGSFSNIERPTYVYGPASSSNPVVVRQRVGGVGPFAGGYGFGVRSTLLGYFLKLDTGWPMNGFFRGKPVWYFALGFDF